MFDLQGYGPLLIKGTLLTIQLGLASLVFGLIFGLLGALAKLSGVWILEKIANAYTTVIRGIPELLMVFFIYFGVSLILAAVLKQFGYTGRIDISQFWAGVAALSIMFGAYATEVFRGAILAIPKGHREAGQALGLSKIRIFWRIILPQMWRIALPGLGNLFMILMKDTALVSVIGLEEIMRQAQNAVTFAKHPFTFYMVAAVMYLGLTVLAMIGMYFLEKRAARGFARGTQ